MKKILGSLFLILIATVAYAQYGSSSSNGSSSNSYDSYSQYGQQGQQQYGQQGQQQSQPMQQQNGVPSDCSHLSQQEQQFASQLSDMHRTMFCRHFSVSQRIEAMTLASTPVQGNGGIQGQMTPDAAVEVVMKGARQDGSNGGAQGQQQTQQQSPYGGSYSYPGNGNNGSSSSRSPYSN
jgi:hypothetical protein